MRAILCILVLAGSAAAQIDLSTQTKGDLPFARGGTGQASWFAGRCVQVSADGTKLESAPAACGTGSGGGTWGSITGVLSAQTDLQSALNAKPNSPVSAANGGNGIANTGAAGKVPIGDGAGHFVEGDPLVQGLYPAGSTSEANPVGIGAWDGAHLHHISIDTSGRLNININGTVPVSGAFWQATQPVSGTVTANISGSIGNTAFGANVNDGAGNAITSNSTTTTSTRGLDLNLRSILGTAPTAAGKLDVKGADGDVFVRQTSGANLHVNVDSAPTTAVTGAFWQSTQPVSATSLPLPTGAATDASVTNPQVAGGGTTAPTKVQMVGGKSNDGTPQYDAVPLGAGGRSVIVEGFAGGTAIPVSLASAPSTAVTNAGTFAVQAAATIADGADVTLGAKADAKSTATDTTPVTAMQVLKEISFMAQTPAALPNNQSVNIAQVAGSTASTATTGVQLVGIEGHAGAVFDGATGAAVPANAVLIAGKGSGNSTAPIVCDNWKPFSISSTTVTKLVALASAKKVYICSINLVVAAASNVALIEGTKVTNECDTSTVGLAGGTTAATGWNLPANGGLAMGSGFGAIIASQSAGQDLCIVQSASTQLSGAISWTQQ